VRGLLNVASAGFGPQLLFGLRGATRGIDNYLARLLPATSVSAEAPLSLLSGGGLSLECWRILKAGLKPVWPPGVASVRGMNLVWVLCCVSLSCHRFKL